MKTIVLDTNILIDNIHGFAPWVKKLLKLENYKQVIPTIVLPELGRIRSEEYLSLFIKQDLNEEIAKILGAILRHETYPAGAGLADLIIAATTLYLNGELATKNKADFYGIPDLKFFDPKKLAGLDPSINSGSAD